jgi:PAS domain S-box-containing protein
MKSNLKIRKSLKARITLISLVVFMVSIWSLLFYLSRVLQKDLQGELGEQQFSTVSIMTSEIDHEVVLRFSSLKKVAEHITPAILNNTSKLQTLLEDRPILDILFNGGYFVVQADGMTVADFPFSTGRIGMNVSERGWMTDALKGKSTIGKPIIGKKLQAPVFTMASPIRDSGGKVIGVLTGVTDLSKSNFLDRVVDNKYGKTGGFLLAAPQHNLIVTATDKKRIMQPLPAPGVNPLFDRYNQGFEGFGRSVNSLGVEELTASKQIPAAGWYLIVKTPITEAFAPFYNTQQHFIVATIILTLLVGCVIWWVLKHHLSPIFATVNTLTRMSEGSQPADLLPVVRQDELGLLISSFNALLKSKEEQEESFKLSEQRFRKAIEEAPFPIMIHAEDGEVLALSRTWTELSGYTLADIPTIAIWTEKAYGIHKEPVIEEINTLYNLEHRKSEGEYTVNCHDGTRRIWDFSSVSISFLSDGRRTAMSMAADVTERKRAEEEKHALEQQFQQTQKLESLGVLAGGIAHDFNNILAIIMGYCALTKMDYETTEYNILEIEKAAERAAALCRQMLAYAGKASLTQTQVNTWMLVDEMVSMLKTTIQKNVVIKPNLGADIPTSTGDASQIRQVVMNLIINAAEAIGDAEGEIYVSLEKAEIKAGQPEKDHLGFIIPAGRYILFEVTDNGCGMDDETRRKIFEPFYTTKFTGRGLGMSAVLGIIRAHNGALQLQSQPGQGTTFKVYLPVQLSKSETEEANQKVVSAAWQGSGTILLAEDEEQVKSIAIALLQKLGFTVLDATNGKEALELYRKNATEITLVVTDMGMPVMNGYELFYKLKQLDPKLPIIISSGFGEGDIISKIPREEIAGVINKPYNFDQLRDVLKRVV